MKSTIAFVGMTHLGINSAVSAAEKGFNVICFDPDEHLINALKNMKLFISEPQLVELIIKNQQRLHFSSDPKEILCCDVVYVAPDVSTDDQGQSDLSTINRLLAIVFDNTSKKNVIVILSQVPPGFTRGNARHDKTLFYQVETLIFGQAINRALFPERYIVGCLNPKEELPQPYMEFLEAYSCPILPMRYESAEVAKISINMFLVASVSTANTLAELCEQIGADWSEIAPALRLDRRIGLHSYLSPGLGLSGGNLERDLATLVKYANEYGTDDGVVKAWIANSQRRKNWIWATFEKLRVDKGCSKKIGILGLTYKENTHSLKNSPALLFLSQLEGHEIIAYDPKAALDAAPIYVKRAQTILEVIKGAEILVLSTAWPEFRAINVSMLLEGMTGRVIIDPYGMLDGNELIANGFFYHRLGLPS
jgi:UDPglucose 6-dehydrogenase